MARNLRKRTIRTNLVSVIPVTVVVACLAFVVGLRVDVLKEKDRAYEAKEQSLLSQIQEQEERTEKLEEYSSYVRTDEYYEEIAKEKLGLVNPDEILLKPNN